MCLRRRRLRTRNGHRMNAPPYDVCEHRIAPGWRRIPKPAASKIPDFAGAEWLRWQTDNLVRVWIRTGNGRLERHRFPERELTDPACNLIAVAGRWLRSVGNRGGFRVSIPARDFARRPFDAFGAAAFVSCPTTPETSVRHDLAAAIGRCIRTANGSTLIPAKTFVPF